MRTTLTQLIILINCARGSPRPRESQGSADPVAGAAAPLSSVDGGINKVNPSDVTATLVGTAPLDASINAVTPAGVMTEVATFPSPNLDIVRSLASNSTGVMYFITE